eukprot:TRINITY_DN558_c0_g1_i1.p2 TRINITY_DN558_c0_g1~~TRINITY_DN558_c0_g1_i1.p2  ORF type:complete len:193 (-),score=20.73 TRINITY_DN558_c0_g1_i1:301-879(-)
MARAVLFCFSVSAESVQLIVEFSQPLLAFPDVNFAGFTLGHTTLQHHHHPHKQQPLSTERMFPNWHFEVERCMRLFDNSAVPQNLLQPTFNLLNEVRQTDRIVWKGMRADYGELWACLSASPISWDRIMLFKHQRFVIVSCEKGYPRVVTPDFCDTNADYFPVELTFVTGTQVPRHPRNAQETFFTLEIFFR